jgi:hypothetical protein
LINNIGQTRMGSSGSYVQIAKDGRLTLAGSARVYKSLWLPATQWYGIEPNSFANPFNATATSAGSTPTVRPYAADFGSAAGSKVSIPVMSASQATNLDSRMATSFIVPQDAATTGSVQPKLFFTTKVAMATAGSMQVYRLNYQYIGSTGSPNLTDSGSVLYGGSMASTGNGKMEIWDLGDLPSFNAAASPLVLLQLTLEQSNGSCMAGSAEDQILGMRIDYQADALGAQSMPTV